MRLFNKIIFALFLGLFVLTPFFNVSAVDYTSSYSWKTSGLSISVSGNDLVFTSAQTKIYHAFIWAEDDSSKSILFSDKNLFSNVPFSYSLASFSSGNYHIYVSHASIESLSNFSYFFNSYSTFSSFISDRGQYADTHYYYYLSTAPSAVYGCTDSSASNYDDEATVDDGSCEFAVYGCTDSSASNYDDEATVDDGSCEFMSYIPSSVISFTGFFLDQILGSHVSGSPLSSISYDSGGYFFDYHELYNSLPDFNYYSTAPNYVSAFDLYNDYLSDLITLTFNEPIPFSDLADSSDFIYIGTRQNLYSDNNVLRMLLLIKGNTSVYYKVITPLVSRSYDIDGQIRPAFIYKIPVSDVLVSDGNSSKLESLSIIPATFFSSFHISGKDVNYNPAFNLVPRLQLFSISPDDIDLTSNSFSTYFGGLETLADNLSFNMAFSGGQNVATPDLSGIPQSPLDSGVVSLLANGVPSNSNTSVPVNLDFYYNNADDYTYLKYVFMAPDSASLSGFLPISSGIMQKVSAPVIPFVSGLTYSGQVWMSYSSESQSFSSDSDIQTFTLTTSPLPSASYGADCGDFDIACHLKKFTYSLFSPSQSSYDSFSSAQFRNRIPFSYVYDLPSLLTRIKNAPPDSFTLSATIFDSEIVFLSDDIVEDWSFVSFGRNLLGAVMIFFTIWGVIRIAYLSLSDDE